MLLWRQSESYSNQGGLTMNREILFRGQRLEDGKWIYGYYFEHDMADGLRSYIRTPQAYRFGTDFAVDPATVGQYTGQNAACKDSQGQICRKQQVFEHDILADQNGKIIGCVKFTDERGWMVGVESLYDYTDRYDEKEALIIGNIHDNPDMLKGGEK